MKLAHSYSSIKMFENCPHRYYHQRIKKSVVDKGGEASMNGERIHKYLEDRIKEGTPLPAEIAHLENAIEAIYKIKGDGFIEAEREMTLDANLKPSTWFSPDAWMRSKIDVLVLRDEKAAVLDWKTGKRRPDPTQLELFALQVFAHYPYIKSVSTTFLWIPDKATDSETYTRSMEADMWASLLKRVNRIEQSLEADKWPAKPSGLCNYCPCKSFCEYAR